MRWYWVWCLEASDLKSATLFLLKASVTFPPSIICADFGGWHQHPSTDYPDTFEVIKFRRDQAGLTVKDLEPMNGQPNRVDEVLNHQWPFTLGPAMNDDTKFPRTQ
jgi:hypothetical protein